MKNQASALILAKYHHSSNERRQAHEEDGVPAVFVPKLNLKLVDGKLERVDVERDQLGFVLLLCWSSRFRG